LFGQSYQVAGRNSFEHGDMADTGLQSGLDKKNSDYVGRIMVAPTKELSITTRSRFDEDTFGMKRLEVQANALFGPLSTSVIFARYAAQPALAIPDRREGLLTSATWNLTPTWSVNGSVLFAFQNQDNITRLNNPGLFFAKSSPYNVAALSLGAGYKDECTTFAVTYTSSFNDQTSGVRTREQSVLVRLELRTLGQATFRQNIGGTSGTQDGISQ
jgi:LPS-assembly protein